MTTWYVNLNSKKWIRGPDLSQGRSDLTCSLITKPSKQIVIVGGFTKDNNLSKRMDVIDLNKNSAVRGELLYSLSKP